MSQTEIDKSYFVAFCIEQYKVAKGMDGAAVAEFFYRYGVRNIFDFSGLLCFRFVIYAINDSI